MAELSGLVALPDGSLFKGRILFSEKIESVEPDAVEGDDYVLPGLIDLQVNGSHGIGVMEATSEAILDIAAHLAREGTTAFLPTAVTAPVEKIERIHFEIARAMEQQQDSRVATIAGMHLEGPFISPRRLGAHPAHNLLPRGKDLECVLAMTALRVVTLAPELIGATDAIRRLTDRGVVVSIGHTDATLEQAQAAVAAGARMFTHLCNAMRPLHHRDPGVVAAAMMPSPARPAVIPDGVHVHPAMLRLIFAARGSHDLLLTTDKTSFAGLSGQEGSLSKDEHSARVQHDAVRLADGTIAGSVISMLEGVRLMVNRVGVSISDAALMAATNPAEMLGLADRGRIASGCRADLIVLDRTLELKAVYVAGHQLN